MLHFKTKTDIIIDSLQARLNQIKEVANPLYIIDSKTRNYLKLYKEISLYIHTIMVQLETRSLFVSLVSYKKSVSKDPKFLELISRIEQNVTGVAAKILLHKEYDKLLIAENKKFANPNLSHSAPTLSIGLLLSQLQYFKYSDGNNDDYLKRTSGVLEKVLAECSNKGMADLDPLVLDINNLHRNIEQYEFIWTSRVILLEPQVPKGWL